MSTDGGSSWDGINDGLSTKAATALALSADGQVLYAATSGEGVFYFSDGKSGNTLEGELLLLPNLTLKSGVEIILLSTINSLMRKDERAKPKLRMVRKTPRSS